MDREPKRIFNADLSTGGLTDWTIEQHVPDGYTDFAVRDRRLVFFDKGNRILPNIPDIDNFVVSGTLDADWNINGGKYAFTIFFAYDRHKREGHALEFGASGARGFARLRAPGAGVMAEQTFDADSGNTGVIDFEVRRDPGGIHLKLDGRDRLACPLGRTMPGPLAFTRDAFLGELRLHALAIASGDALAESPLWSGLRIPFAPLNGMDIPIVWTVDATRVGTAVRLEVELSGGEKTRPDIPWFPYHGHYVEFLDTPYLRVEAEGTEAQELVIAEGELVLARPAKKYFYLIGHTEPPWPLKRTFYLRHVAPRAVLFAGYKAYGNRAVNKHIETLEPWETACDAVTRERCYAGPTLPPGGAAIALRSPDDKRIVSAIPSGIPARDRALSFARENHYFMEGEPCRLAFDIHIRPSAAARRLVIEWRLESAFFEPMTEYREVGLASAPEHVALDIERWRSNPVELGVLPPGVYHLRYRLRDGAVTETEAWRALEVLGNDRSGAAASGLPVCFSMSNEVKGQDTDYFDPWRPDCADVSHYISIAAGIMPHFARERRFWELAHLYRREWFLWLGSRVMEDPRLEAQLDLVAHCDHLVPKPTAQDVLFRLCSRQFYVPAIVEVLHAFAVGRGFRVAEIKACLDSRTLPGKALFDALVDTCFYEWVDFFCQHHERLLQDFKARVRAVNPAAKISSYGPVAIYAGLYKTAHATAYVGTFQAQPGLEKLQDGYFMLEDYPRSCRYSIRSGPFFLASFKACAPAVRVYPEMYNHNGSAVPCPDAAVARAWPSYGMARRSMPTGASLKSVLEYVFACVWHDGDTFHYWRDYGFHTRTWERERFAALLRLWGFVRKAPPRRPLKANAFVCNEACCRHHKVYYDEYPDDEHEALGDLFNTAEECCGYTHEMSRLAGQNAGFVTDLDGLAGLDAADVDTLVLPPLTRITPDQEQAIRRLHGEGVSLLAFEEVAGLEDLFGVTAGTPAAVHEIRLNEALADNPLQGLAERVEYTAHRACIGKYRATKARVLLDAEIPVLFLNRTPSGMTALYNIPPTAVRRQDQANRVSYGRASISGLINDATRRVLLHMSRPAAAASEGTLIAFEDQSGGRHLIVMEDSHPFPSRPIRPIVTLDLPGLKPGDIRCDTPLEIFPASDNRLHLRLSLEPDGFAIIHLPG